MECKFIIQNPNFPNIKTCKECGRIVESNHIPEKIHARCNKQHGYVTTGKVSLKVKDENKNNDRGPVKKINENHQPPEQKKVEMPGVGQMALNAFKAIGQFIANPTTVSKEQYQERLLVCSSCDKYDDIGNRCGVCGCFLAAKAKGAAFHCPLKKWPGDT